MMTDINRFIEQISKYIKKCFIVGESDCPDIYVLSIENYRDVIYSEYLLYPWKTFVGLEIYDESEFNKILEFLREESVL